MFVIVRILSDRDVISDVVSDFIRLELRHTSSAVTRWSTSRPRLWQGVASAVAWLSALTTDQSILSAHGEDPLLYPTAIRSKENCFFLEM